LHGVPKKIVSDRGTQFTSKFWEMMHETLDTQLRFRSAYHPQTDGQTERVNQILEDMLSACPCNMKEVGIRVYLTPSFRITTSTKKA
jgi:transposase InsO family protein